MGGGRPGSAEGRRWGGAGAQRGGGQRGRQRGGQGDREDGEGGVMRRHAGRSGARLRRGSGTGCGRYVAVPALPSVFLGGLHC